MALRDYKGAAAALVLSGNITATTLSIVTTGTVTGWPTGGANGKFLIVIDRGGANEEKVLVTSRSGNTLTVASTGDRGADDTAAASHISGVAIEHCIGAIDVHEPNAHINTLTADDHTQYLKTDGTRAFSGLTAIGGTILGSAPGDVTANGSGVTLARANHVHGRAVGEPLGTLGKALITANQTFTAGIDTDMTGYTASGTVAGTSRYLKISFRAFLIGASGTNNVCVISLKEGATVLDTSIFTAVNVSQVTSFSDFFILTGVSAGAHTYKLSLNAGSGNMNQSNSPSAPIRNGWFVVEDIGT